MQSIRFSHFCFTITGAGDVDVDDLEDSLESFEITDTPRKVIFPHNKSYHGDIRTSNAYCTLVIQLPAGQHYAYIENRNVIVEAVVDATLYQIDTFMAYNPFFDSLEGGAFVTSYAAEGCCYIEEEQDWQYPDRIRHRATYPIKFDIEQNFMARGNVPAQYTWVSPQGNRFLLLNMVQVRDNQHGINANVHRMGPQAAPQPPYNDNFSAGFQQPNFGPGFEQTPPHGNFSGFQQQQGSSGGNPQNGANFSRFQQQAASPPQNAGNFAGFPQPQQPPTTAQFNNFSSAFKQQEKKKKKAPPQQQYQAPAPEPSPFPQQYQAHPPMFVFPQEQQQAFFSPQQSTTKPVNFNYTNANSAPNVACMPMQHKQSKNQNASQEKDEDMKMPASQKRLASMNLQRPT